MRTAISVVLVVVSLLCCNPALAVEQSGGIASSQAATSIPSIDISGETGRHVIIAQGTEEIYQGHPTTLLMPDGKSIFCVWTRNHGGPCGPMARSDDGGLSWVQLQTPDDWKTVKNCPTIWRLSGPQGPARLMIFAGQGPDRTMHQSWSADDGKRWSPMRSVGLECVMPFCAIVPVEGGNKLVGLTNIRRPGETREKLSNVLAQSESSDGGLTWTPWRVLLDKRDVKYCEPAVVRSPDGKQLLCLLRENAQHRSWCITSDDEARTWSAARQLPWSLSGDRHMARYVADGRLVVCFRDQASQWGTRGHFVAWVGRYEDALAGRDGQYRVKLLHSYKGSDCGYPGLEVLPDGTLLAATYIKYRPGPEKNSVVSVRFRLSELDGRSK